MSSCFGFRKSKHEDDTEALLPLYENDTSMQRSIHQKMHTYQMYRALSKGFMPSNEQLIVNLRTLLAADILNPDNPDLSDSGRLMVKHTKQWLAEFIEMLRNKNDVDAIQDFIWYLSKSKVSLDTEDLANRASNVKSKADTTAAYESLRTVGNLLLTNSDFRLFLGDMGTIGRQVFADTAFSLSNVAEEAGKQLEPSEEQSKQIQKPGADDGPPPGAEDLEHEVNDVSKIVANGIVKTGKDAVSSAQENISGEQKDTLISRLKKAVIKLRKRNDYSDSVSTLGLLIKRYALAYSRAADETLSAAQNDVQTNSELDRAIRNFWSLLSSFGDRQQWQLLEEKFNKVMSHSQKDPQFENLMMDVGNSVQKLLTDPDFFESADNKIQELRDKAKQIDNESDLRKDIDAVLAQMQTTFHSVLQDTDISKLISTTTQLIHILSPTHTATNPELITDAIHIFIPLLIQTIQYIPIPRLEVSVPELDLLLENLIIEPGRTINHTSFFPYKLQFKTYNDLRITKHKFRTTTSTTSLVTINVNGLSVRADEVGFWLRAHPNYFFRLADEGIMSFQLDDRGVDIALDVEIGKEKLEQILTLKAVRVHIHKLSYTLRKSKFSWLAWLVKPLLRPLLRKVMEKQLATAIADACHFANRELVFARERLRATRISDPRDVRTFVKAV
ncbi:MAG: hypothetical protein Q9222_004316, partial [Ikaeria aurantiellina]